MLSVCPYSSSFSILGLKLPDVFSPFANSETNDFISFAVSNWSSMYELMDLPDLMGGLKGLRPQLRLSPLQTKCVRFCLLAIHEIISVLQSHCPEVNRGDVCAIVSAFSEFSSVMVSLVDMFIPSSYGIPRDQKLLILADFSFSKAIADEILLMPKMAQFIDDETLLPKTLAVIRKRFLSLISALFTYLQEIVVQWFNRGLPFF